MTDRAGMARVSAILAGGKAGHYRLPDAVIAADAAVATITNALGAVRAQQADAVAADAQGDAVKRVVSAAMGGTNLPDFVDDVLAARDHRARLNLQATVLADALERIEGALVGAVQAHDDELFAELDRALGDTLARAREAGRAFEGAAVPGGDAVAHMPKAKADAWRTLDAMASRLSSIRDGQDRLYLLTGQPQRADEWFTAFRDPLHHQVWGDRYAGMYQSPWVPGPQGRFERLLWLASLPPGLAWVPTADQADAACAAYVAKVRGYAASRP